MIKLFWMLFMEITITNRTGFTITLTVFTVLDDWKLETCSHTRTCTSFLLIYVFNVFILDSVVMPVLGPDKDTYKISSCGGMV